MQRLLLISVFVVATCGIIYELAAGTIASYLLGDSITQFSTIIGTYLFSMGIGSWLSRFFKKNLSSWFVQCEILVGLIGGISSAVLFISFEKFEYFRLILYFFVCATGILVGLEIPLLMRMLKDKVEFSDLVSKVFSFDYVGALLASIIFPVFLVPKLGMIKTSFLFGILNVAVAYIVCYQFRKELHWFRYLQVKSIVVILFLLAGFVMSDSIMAYAEREAYGEKIIFSKSTKYQRIVITRHGEGFRLYLNGNLQFDSSDEYRYHEALVHPAMSAAKKREKVLVMGGGDGLALRELLKYPDVKEITLVDLDEEMTKLFSTNEVMNALNKSSFKDKKIKTINADAFSWLKESHEKFDLAVIDFPDPNNFSLGKLYSNYFYRMLAQRLNGPVVIQCTSPYVARKSFWCVNKTLQAEGFSTLPYHALVPSFGEWGFIIASSEKVEVQNNFLSDLKFLTAETWEQMKHFPKDMSETETEVNRLNNQALVHYFEDEWSKVQ